MTPVKSPCLVSSADVVRSEQRLIVALDVSSTREAQKIVVELGDAAQIYKVGMQLYTAVGPEIVRELVGSGHEVFLDLKYHDIPNTVAAAVREAAQLGVSMLTVHAAGGAKMLEAAVGATRSGGATPGTAVDAHPAVPQVLAVTVLTSMDEKALGQTGVSTPILDQVLRLASIALGAGCAGVVSSAKEVKALRARCGDAFLAVTPGVRPAGSEHGDQARVVTPSDAIAAGASHIVVGRPITAAKDPRAAAEAIHQEIRAATQSLG
jgi:orotidine-5'-phosphate decarboxylase